MSHSRLIVGSVYGGNDIAGTIHSFPKEEDQYDTYISVTEYEKPDDYNYSPGSEGKHNGFPLIGSLFGAGNGNYGDVVDGKYAEGTIKEIYLGQGTEKTGENPWVDLDLGGTDVPNIEKTNINIKGGTIVDAYCGGDNTTVTGKAVATVDYETLEARAGFDNTNGVDDPKRIWNLFELSSQEQFEEVLQTQDEKEMVYRYQIYHFYSGNNNADMDIQPQVDLVKGHIGSVYGGGNNGRMTYWREEGENDPNPGRKHGIEMSITSPTIHIEELYGGGRIGDIAALDDEGNIVKFKKDEYGATVNVHAGLIEAVYGGNDVCGTVYNGTNVNIYGAIAGDVYGAGNGNYLYKLDTNLPVDSHTIYEEYDDEEHGGRYFRVPPKSAYGGKKASAAQRIMAINSYRPNVEKSYLNLHGTRIDETQVDGYDNANRVWVKGSVYCGGNSSTIRRDIDFEEGDVDDENKNTIRFNIGDYVVLNGVFLGSNGSSLADTRADGMMMRFEKINNLQLNQPNDLTPEQVPAYDLSAASNVQYPYLLSLYMRAVEVDGVPDEFNFDITRGETFIGDFCLGGNRGSMMTDRTIRVTLPENLTIFGNIIGGCYDTAFEYQGVMHSGGMTQFLSTHEGTSTGDDQSDISILDPTLDENNKVWLSVKNRFFPLRVVYPVNDDIFKITLEPDIIDPEGTPYYGANRCNIYGGCYNSGLTIGDIRIDLFSDMAEFANFQYILNGIDRQVRALDVVGAGYGKMSYVIGDTKVRMRPGGRNMKDEKIHPRCAAIFGGSQEGQLLGNSFVSILDGQVMTNVYGGSESAVMRGNATVIIGYPTTYRCKKSGVYYLNRADTYSDISLNNVKDARGNEVVKKKIWLLEDDIIAANVFDIICGYNADVEGSTDIALSSNEEKEEYFLNVTATPETFKTSDMEKITWDDIEIKVGVNNMYKFDDPNNPYYGHGNVYGGGFVSNHSDVTLAGKPTVLKYDDTDVRINTRKELRKGYGGNSMVLIADNPKNSNLDFEDNADTGEEIRDHITIGTANLKRVVLKAGENKIGKYYIAPENNEYGLKGMDRLFHQEAGKITEQDVANNNNIFYEVEGDGGIYGGGRKVFVEGFRACDLSGYGYAEHSPYHPKHLGTVQRLDLFTIRDCCMQLTGAPDYASTKIDATPYSMTRVGELQMISSLPADDKLDTGEENNSYNNPLMNKPGYPLHSQKRSRNYMGFFNQIRFVGAVHSSTEFDLDNGYAYHDEYGSKVAELSYRTKKEQMVANRKLPKDNNFPKRNVATSHNMIGINNGYTFKVQGIYTTDVDNDTEEIYYGPIEGVVEVKLMTLIEDEGGGYIYALNKHKDGDAFTEMTGNFVYPGRLFGSGEGAEAHYMLDDCFPMGYDYMQENGGWAKEPVHYWYVSGNSYYFNTTLTAYTYNQPKEFFLNNYDELIMLSGIEEDISNLKIKEVTWRDHSDAAYDCDLVNISTEGKAPGPDGYQLYLSVDKNTNLNFPALPEGSSAKDGAYVSRISRADYDDTMTAAADGVNPNSTDNGAFGHKVSAGDNSPLVGIMLKDNMTSDEYMTAEYYKKHLADPHDVTLEIEGNTNGVITKYTINLRIIYLQGPNIKGNIKIENCALPGEIINANTGNMTIDLAEELVIDDRQWVAVNADGTQTVDVSEYRNEYDYTKLELPVWYYNNDWNLYYRLKINGENFDVKTDPASEHPKITVHNYHRMKAMYGDSEIYQILTPGCRVFIEDDADLEKFVAFADSVSRPGHLPRDLEGTILKDRPKDCEGLTFILANNLNVPERDASFTVPARFSGRILGNGYHLTFADTTPLLGTLTTKGEIRDTGFVGCHGDGHVIIDMEPREHGYGLYNSFFYAIDDQGGFNLDRKTTDTFANCTQNCHPDIIDTYHPTYEFEFGRAAYNINGYYLKGRYDKLTGGEPEVETLDDYYYSGDYRFGYYDTYGIGTPTALRTRPRPNYLNRERTGLTNHNMKHLKDEPRYVAETNDGEGNVTPEHYRPLWPNDYLKFGQSLTAQESTSDPYPVHYNTDNRVYRASGFYGSKQDRGFHFNVGAVARQNTLTAIDFTGHNDIGKGYDITHTVDDTRDVFCSPMLDLPNAEDASYGITDLTILSDMNDENSDGITRNLLVYSKDTAISTLVSEMMYTEDTAESDIIGHAIINDGESYDINNDIFHLVDKHDFNAPIEFNVGKRAWYERRPQGYSIGNTAWEGICLPFPANRVSAFGADSHGASVLRDHGEITHFYGKNDGFGHSYEDYLSPNLHNRLHEYWLRSLVGVEDGAAGSNLIFARPGMDDHPYLDEEKQPWEQVTADYHYSNMWFPYTYGPEYINTHNQYMAEGVDFKDYRFLTNDIPYIVTFPSERYYEFDLSGVFYRDNVKGELSAHPMAIRYEYLTGANRTRKEGYEDTRVGSEAAEEPLVIGVSDDASRKVRADRGSDKWLFEGTFMHRTFDEAAYGVIDEEGMNFRRTDYDETVAPFRAFVTSPAAINTRFGIQGAADDPIVTPESNDDEYDTVDMEFFVEDDILVVRSPRQARIALCDISGRVVRFLDIRMGRNEYRDLDQGVYLAGRFKFFIR